PAPALPGHAPEAESAGAGFPFPRTPARACLPATRIRGLQPARGATPGRALCLSSADLLFSLTGSSRRVYAAIPAAAPFLPRRPDGSATQFVLEYLPVILSNERFEQTLEVVVKIHATVQGHRPRLDEERHGNFGRRLLRWVGWVGQHVHGFAAV